MSDLIERDSILRILIEGDGDDEFTTGYNFAVDEYRQKITDIHAVNHWIQCSERLPENNQQCLIYRDIKVSNLKVTTGIYHSDRQVFIGLRHGTTLEDAIAWMPVPEPPKIEVKE